MIETATAITYLLLSLVGLFSQLPDFKQKIRVFMYFIVNINASLAEYSSICLDLPYSAMLGYYHEDGTVLLNSVQ